jgi:hypothetical protein
MNASMAEVGLDAAHHGPHRLIVRDSMGNVCAEASQRNRHAVSTSARSLTFLD